MTKITRSMPASAGKANVPTGIIAVKNISTIHKADIMPDSAVLYVAFISKNQSFHFALSTTHTIAQTVSAHKGGAHITAGAGGFGVTALIVRACAVAALMSHSVERCSVLCVVRIH